VAGVVAARQLAGAGLDRETAALETAGRLEGHLDNVAPCLLGGLAVSWVDAGGKARAVRLDVHPGIRPVVCVPSFEVSTAVARELLPEMVSHRDAVSNAARAALLVEALCRRPDLVFDATEDRLHQQYREPAMPDTIALVTALRNRGLAAVVSGAGPSVLVVADVERSAEVRAVATGWDVRALPVDREGVVVCDDVSDTT
jgi:homoserine kinase